MKASRSSVLAQLTAENEPTDMTTRRVPLDGSQLGQLRAFTSDVPASGILVAFLDLPEPHPEHHDDS
jgi:hypothetical protein